ncbi:hypothetical protein FDECE_4530 [Fusarium decemcellulare]|nr:hypothetical protein FDECE_4530 [Fusarium decemcellulare]
MASNLHTFSGMIACFIILSFLCKPAHAFGAGNVPDNLSMNTSVWKHGDIGDVLKLLPVSFLTNYGFTDMDILRVYFGNWLRDYSQVIDIMPLGKAKEPTLRAITGLVAIALKSISGYAENKQGDYLGDGTVSNLDSRLRRRVLGTELEIDPKTGMKNYIANETIGITTSAGYIRRKIQECVKHGQTARRDNNESRRHEALICLGALLHTLEDFSAHSNYVELVLHCIGEKDIFACVGDKARIPVPNTTQEVAPLVTGTFGSLDVFQSIIGEIDDKTAMKSEGELDALDNILAGAPDFKTVAAGIASALQYVVMLIPGGSGLKTDLQTILKTVQQAESDNSGKDAINIDTNEIWNAIEPIFSFQGKIKRFLIESKEHPQIGLVAKALETLGELVDKLVYSALAVLVEPAVQRVREAIKEGKETIEEVDRQNKNYVNIFAPGSEDDDPSHSILAKDHFSNYLNPVAGRVATATTNWATQRIVECWDTDDDAIVAKNTEEIIKILHHPAFARVSGPTFIQNIMYDIVNVWWNERTPSQQSTLRAHLGKEGIHANADGHHHGDNNPVDATRQFAGKKGFAVGWPGSEPKLTKRPTKDILGDIKEILNKMGETMEKTGKLLEQGVAEASELINKGLDAAGDAISETTDDIGKGLKRGFDEVTSTAEDLAEEAVRGGKKVFDEATRVGQQALDSVEETVNDGVRAVEETVEDVVHGAEEVVSDVGSFVEKGVEDVVDTGAEIVKDVGNFADQAVGEVSRGVEDFGNKAGEVFSDVGKAFSSWW